MASKLTLDDIPVVNFGKFMLDTMSPYRDRPALVNAETGATYTFNDVIDMTERLAAGLQDIGVKTGDVICICSTNRIDYMIAFYAITLVSATCQPVNPTYTTDDLVWVTKACQTKFIFTTPDLLGKVRDVVSQSNTDIKIITFGHADGYISFKSLLERTRGPYRPVPCDPKNDVAALMSSSGTSGFPKNVMISHYSFVSCLILMNAMGAVEKYASLLLMLPMFHGYGLYIITANGHTMGANVVVMSKFTPDSYLEKIQRYKPNLLHVIPIILVMFAKYPKVSQYDLSSVRKVYCGAAPLSQAIEDACMNRLNLRNIDQGYGMTETNISHLNKDNEYRFRAVGKLVPLVDIKIVNQETLQPVQQGEQGEIWIRGPMTSKGYLNLPQATAEMFLPDGFVRTGDLGMEDKDGYLYIVGRLKELIKYKGFQVAPASLEDTLLTHSDVADCGVIGIPDEKAGELPKAFVVEKAGKHVTSKELIDFVADRVSPHMYLRGGVEFIDEIPRTVSGKILRRVLRDKSTQSSKL